jgi:hypothetical protein
LREPERNRRDIEDIDCADVLSIYLTDIGEPGEQQEIEPRIERLNEYWGGKMLAQVNAQTCAGYTKHRGSPGGARRDLETLRAAINHHAKEGFHRGVVRVSLPPKGEARDRWLTRKEAAALLWHCWRHREKQTIHSGLSKGPGSYKSEAVRSYSSVYPDRPVHWHSGRRDSVGITVCHVWAFLRGSGARYLLSESHWQARNQEASDAGTHTASAARPPSALVEP